MKKNKLNRITWLLALQIFVIVLVGCSYKDSREAAQKTLDENQKSEAIRDGTVHDESESTKKDVVMMATTTSTADTGLLDYLSEAFLESTGWELQYTAVGTGEALKMGENGDVDIVFVHSKSSEEAFVENGYGVERIPVMYNDYIIIGPVGVIEAGSDIKVIFKQIIEEQLPFVSRGDDSGTDKKEKGIWKELDIDPTQNPNYIESGQGMGATITMADEQQAFCLADRGTWLKQKKAGDLKLELEIICENDKSLINQYGIIAVSPEMYPEVNHRGADAFIKWICSDEVQELIRKFGVEEFGEPLFVPNAG